MKYCTNQYTRPIGHMIYIAYNFIKETDEPHAAYISCKFASTYSSTFAALNL